MARSSCPGRFSLFVLGLVVVGCMMVLSQSNLFREMAITAGQSSKTMDNSNSNGSSISSDNNQGNIMTNNKEGVLVSKLSFSSLDEIRILIAVVAYDLQQLSYIDVLVDSFRDMCECGAQLEVVIYTTVFEWPTGIMQMLHDRTTCRHVHGQFKLVMMPMPSTLGLNLVRLHRGYFYENLDRFDVFIYTEADHHIRPTHVLAYLAETSKLRETLGEDRFTDYSIGFLRYEIKPDPTDQSLGHYYFEHHWQVDSPASFVSRHVLHVPGIVDEDDGEVYYYFNGAAPFHQGMYMATKDQLEAWSDRQSPNCRFNDTSIFSDSDGMIREKISSLHLFDPHGCNVTQLVPTRHYQDFLIHHMADKYVHLESLPWKPQLVEDIASLFPARKNDSSNDIENKDVP